MKLLIIGAGYVGLVTATCFAEVGFQVTCLDIDESKINRLKKACIPIYEMGLQEMVQRSIKAGRLHFTTNYEEGLNEAQACFICVDTPSDSHGACDLSSVNKVARSLAQHMSSPLVIVIKSTAPIGTCESVRDLIAEQLKILNKSSITFDIASNPEFLKEGCAINDFMKPDRVVIGVESNRVGELLEQLYSPFNLNHDRILIVDLRSSEMIKYASNAMLATRISFMNELSGLCEHLGADISKVRKGIGSDSRIGHAFLYAGLGYGGSCFPKDIRALRALARTKKHPTAILDAVEQVNSHQKLVLAEKIIAYYDLAKLVGPKTIAIWGLAFKPDTDDMREAPALILIEQLCSQGYTVKLYDPVAMENAKPFVQDLAIDQNLIIWCQSEYEAATKADGIALVTEWKQFRQIDFNQIRSLMNHAVVFDGRNQYLGEELAKHGFDHIPVGRQPTLK
jgi:UDPglucose 6-dehydrogenase